MIDSPADAIELAETAISSLPATHGDQRSGTRLSTVAELRGQVDDVLYESATDQGRPMGYADAVAGLVLGQAATAAQQTSGHRFAKLDNLRAHDRLHGSDYTITPAAYLNAFGDINAAATRLGIHRTTLRYRLRRITELALINIDDPSERLLCALLLRKPSVPGRPEPS